MSEFPLRLGDAADFARVAAALRGPGFSEAAVHAALRGAGQTSLGSDASEESPAESSVLLRLFVELAAVPHNQVEQAIDRETLDSFLALDLLRLNAGAYESPVFLYPVGDFLIASDHYNKSLGADSVFPAIQSGTLHLLKLLPRTPVEEALDLCSGAGICGFALSRHARHVNAADVSARCGHFARFNRLLNVCTNNGCAKVEIAVGDLYSPVEGRTFDRIVAHPPYMPSLDEAKIWRDAGSTGEAVTRRIIEGLPRHLKPGGEFLALCLGAEHADVPFQQRVREWLGAAESEFDVLCAAMKMLSPQELARQLSARDAPGEAERKAAAIEAAFREAGVARFCYGALILRRHASAARSWTMRTSLAPDTGAESFEHIFRVARTCETPGVLPEMRLKLAEGIKATLGHRVEAATFTPSELTLETVFPFPNSIRLQPWLFGLLERFDGAKTVAEIYRESGLDHIAFDDLAPLIAMLVIQGYLAY